MLKFDRLLTKFKLWEVKENWLIYSVEIVLQNSKITGISIMILLWVSESKREVSDNSNNFIFRIGSLLLSLINSTKNSELKLNLK